MYEKRIEVKSHWRVTVKNEYLVQDSDVLVIILPGGRYTTYAPLLYYSYNASVQAGYDILAVEYGFRKAEQEVVFNGEALNITIKETKEAVEKCINERKYKKLIFIGKCIGTLVQNSLMNEFKSFEQKNVFLTPWPQCIDSILETDSLAIVGTKDNGFREEHINIIKNKDNSKIKVIQDANHDLEKDDFRDSIELLKEITEFVYDFIK